MKDRLQNVNRCSIADNGLPEQLMNFEDMMIQDDDELSQANTVLSVPQVFQIQDGDDPSEIYKVFRKALHQGNDRKFDVQENLIYEKYMPQEAALITWFKEYTNQTRADLDMTQQMLDQAIAAETAIPPEPKPIQVPYATGHVPVGFTLQLI